MLKSLFPYLKTNNDLFSDQKTNPEFKLLIKDYVQKSISLLNEQDQVNVLIYMILSNNNIYNDLKNEFNYEFKLINLLNDSSNFHHILSEKIKNSIVYNRYDLTPIISLLNSIENKSNLIKLILEDHVRYDTTDKTIELPLH